MTSAAVAGPDPATGSPTAPEHPRPAAGEVCRLVVVGPVSTVELAVPVHVPLADLLPTLIGHLGPGLPENGLAHGGWVLQRLGEPPLDEDLGTAGLGLYDGDTLHLRPRADQLPLVAFDDMVDGVATGMAERPDSWRPGTTRIALLTLAAAALLLAAVAAAAAGGAAVTAVTAGGVALLLLTGAAGASRAIGDRAAGLVLGAGGVGLAAVAGAALPAAAVGTALPHTGPAGALGAAACTAAAALCARAAVGGGGAGWIGVAAGAGCLALGAGAGAVTGLDGAQTGAITLTLTLLAGLAVPGLAGRLSGLRIPSPPRSPEEFQADLAPEPSSEVLARAARADGHLSALYVALGAAAGLAMLPLAAGSGWAPPALCGAAGLLLLLHSRELRAIPQRLACVLAAGLGSGAAAAVRVQAAGVAGRLLAAVALVLAGGLLVVAARRLPHARLVPRWGRAGDLLQTAAAVSVLPLVLDVLGVYGRIRGGLS